MHGKQTSKNNKTLFFQIKIKCKVLDELFGWKKKKLAKSK